MEGTTSGTVHTVQGGRNHVWYSTHSTGWKEPRLVQYTQYRVEGTTSGTVHTVQGGRKHIWYSTHSTGWKETHLVQYTQYRVEGTTSGTVHTVQGGRNHVWYTTFGNVQMNIQQRPTIKLLAYQKNEAAMCVVGKQNW